MKGLATFASEGKKVPKNQRRVIIPAKLVAATVRMVMDPKQAIIMGRTTAGPNFLPSIPLRAVRVGELNWTVRLTYNGGAHRT